MPGAGGEVSNVPLSFLSWGAEHTDSWQSVAKGNRAI